MILGTENIVLIGSILLFVSIIASKFSSKLGTPTLLLFLMVGMLFGSDGVGIQFDSPAITQFIGMIALSIILFSGGMDTRTDDIKPVAAEGITLATIGVLLTAGITGTFIYYISQFIGVNLSFLESLLLASIMSSTDSASVFSIFSTKKQGLKENLRPLLELESGSNDPMAYILTVMLIQVATGTEEGSAWQVVLTFLKQMGIGALSGYLLAELAARIINRINIGNKSLYSTLLLSLVFFTYSFTDLVGGNGYLAVYIAGIVMGNKKLSYKRTLSTFFDGVTWLFQIVMFLMLGLLVNPHELIDIAPVGLLIGVFMIAVARPLAVLISLLPSGKKFTRKAKAYISWVGLRGAAPILFATYPKLAGLDPDNTIFNIVFFITIISLLVQGTTVSSMAEVLGVSARCPEQGFDIDLPDEIKADLTEVEVTEENNEGKTLKEITLPEKTLIMMIRREGRYIIPNGSTTLKKGDLLLLISEDAQEHSTEIQRKGKFALWRHIKVFIKS